MKRTINYLILHKKFYYPGTGSYNSYICRDPTTLYPVWQASFRGYLLESPLIVALIYRLLSPDDREMLTIIEDYFEENETGITADLFETPTMIY